MAYARTSLRAEKRALREKMRAMGLGHQEIAAEFARRYQLRPRAAWREAQGWSLQEAADRINSHVGGAGLDPGGVAAMTAAHLCEYDNWPGHGAKASGRRPSARLLAVLAAVYGCAVTDLVDLADREHFSPGDLLVLDACHSDPGGVRVPAAAPSPIASALPALIPRPGGAAARASTELAGIAARDVTRYADQDAWPVSLHVAYRWVQEPVF